MAKEKTITDDDQGKEMIQKLGEVAKDYSQLELMTQMAVRQIQSYGENCDSSIEDFLEDGNYEELLNEVGNIEEIKTSFLDVARRHQKIK